MTPHGRPSPRWPPGTVAWLWSALACPPSPRPPSYPRIDGTLAVAGWTVRPHGLDATEADLLTRVIEVDEEHVPDDSTSPTTCQTT